MRILLEHGGSLELISDEGCNAKDYANEYRSDGVKFVIDMIPRTDADDDGN